jgi:site-specific DNA-methyltransferase (adenine-specific)
MPEKVGPFELGRVHRCEALEGLRLLPEGSLDAVVTDPPYSNGGQFRGDRTDAASNKYVQSGSHDTCRDEFSGDNRDQRSFMVWASAWMLEALKACRSGSVLLVFSDWRQLPTMTDAVQCGGWVWRNVVTWWKPGIRMQRGRFSASAEYIVYATSGIPAPGEASPQNVLPHAPVPGEEKKHIAEKPVSLMLELLGVTPPGALILDPFAGSGTTGVACRHLGRRFLGFDLDARWCELANDRIAAAKEGLSLAELRAGQGQLFGGDDA